MTQNPQTTIVLTPGLRIRTFGGWYKHTVVSLDGKELGRFQLRRQNKRDSLITIVNGTCVTGRDLDWLLTVNGLESQCEAKAAGREYIIRTVPYAANFA